MGSGKSFYTYNVSADQLFKSVRVYRNVLYLLRIVHLVGNVCDNKFLLDGNVWYSLDVQEVGGGAVRYYFLV